MSLVELLCPRCGRGLDPRPRQRVHACAECHGSWEAVSGQGLVPVPRSIVRPKIAPPWDARLVLLPVWCVTVHRERLGKISDRMAGEIRIPANGIARMPLLVAAARRMTRDASPCEDWTAMEAPVDPAEMDAETAFAVAEAVALRHVDGWPSQNEVESVQIPLGSARLVDWPCANVGAELVELVGGLSLPEALVQNIGSRDQRSALGAEIARLDHTSDFVRSRTGG
jgi:hypothetical protein